MNSKPKEEINVTIRMAKEFINTRLGNIEKTLQKEQTKENLSNYNKYYLQGFQQIKFQKESEPDSETTEIKKKLVYKPIETLFDEIENIAAENSVKAKIK